MATSQAHDHDIGEASDRRILGTVALNVVLTVAQIVGGVLAGSVALVADALHNLNDAMALVIVWITRRISRRRADRERTFGYQRAQVIGALVNLVALGVVALFLGYESVLRFFEPRDVGGWTVIVLAGVALVVDVGTVLLLITMRKGNVNVRAAFAHNLSDALASLAVLIGGVAIVLWGVNWVDPFLSLAIVGYIIWQVVKMLPETLRVLMESAPPGLDVHQVASAIMEVEGVADVHHVHVWMLDEEDAAGEAHIVIDHEDLPRMESIKVRVRQKIESFGIAHSTLEVEFPDVAGDPDHDGSVIV